MTMKPKLICTLCLAGALSLGITGCGQKTPASAAKDLEQAFQAAPGAPAEPKVVIVGSSPAPNAQPDVKAAVSEAATAMRTNGYAEAFTLLRSIQAAPTITVNQYEAVANARLAVERELAAKAA